jgi:hypothetical protein
MEIRAELRWRTVGGCFAWLMLEQYFRQFATYTPFDFDDEVRDVRNRVAHSEFDYWVL